MQLDLFLDNERTIRINLAHDALSVLDFPKALREYGMILKKTPGDEEARREEARAGLWARRIETYRYATASPDRLHRLFSEMESELSLSLRRGLLRFFIDELRKESRPERIFHPPAFHIGDLHMALDEYAEAERWFAKALKAGIVERGRFLARRGDALFRTGDTEGARECYLAAFLEDPEGVDLESISDREVIDLIDDLEMEGHEKEEILSALPILGWFRGLFPLLPYGTGDDPAAALARLEEDPETAPMQLWYESLRYAEYLRTRHRADREMIRVRRRMKELSPELFQAYLKKLGMAALSSGYRV